MATTTKRNERFFINIQPFMIYDLKLSGSELFVYAVIYSLTQHKGSCKAKADFLAVNIGRSIRSVRAALKSLTEKGFIENHSRQGSFTEYISVDLKQRESAPSETVEPSQETVEPTTNSAPTCAENCTTYESENNIVMIQENNYNNTLYKAPTLEETETAAAEMNTRNDIDPKRVAAKFHGYYSENEWRNDNGKDIRKTWRGKLRMWLDRERPETIRTTAQKQHKDTQTNNTGSFATDDFFSAALRRSYGDTFTTDDNEKQTTGSFDTDDFFEAALRRSYNTTESA